MRPLLATRLRTTLSLGVRNVARVASYRLCLRAGIHPVQRIGAPAPARGPFFAPIPVVPLDVPRPMVGTVGQAFGWRAPVESGVPDWHRNPFTGQRPASTDAPWWTLGDFDSAIGDIKTVWEASRFDWVVHFAQQAVLGDERAIARLNEWLDDWAARNPPYRGLNWKCGQEASIRVMHLAVAALVLGQTDAPTPGLAQLLVTHLERIAPTVGYAIGQDNNHGTSEAAALIIGGSWLERLGVAAGAAWHRTGRRLLADRARQLIAPDGSFSQHSVNYHRLMLDTISLAEVWRRRLALSAYEDIVFERAVVATDWLFTMTDRVSGDAPNIGANDGADLLPLTGAGYRDFRPAVSLAAALFQGRAPYPEPGPWHHQLGWLGVAAPEAAFPEPASRLFDDGGFVVLRRGEATVVLRYPRFRFRPGHADALHVDLWQGGENLLRDGGTFSYNAEGDAQEYFTGVRSHNTVQFDDREQMPRLGRFLWGAWPRARHVEPIREAHDGVTASASYRDWRGASHTRRVTLLAGSLRVVDTVSAFTSRAVLRWRLRPGAWHLAGEVCSDGAHRLTVSADVEVVRRELVAGWESRYYMHREPVPVLEVEVASAGTVVSEYRWTA